jgi:hypothetical protein
MTFLEAKIPGEFSPGIFAFIPSWDLLPLKEALQNPKWSGITHHQWLLLRRQ